MLLARVDGRSCWQVVVGTGVGRLKNNIGSGAERRCLYTVGSKERNRLKVTAYIIALCYPLALDVST